jgi:hypothetical protein
MLKELSMTWDTIPASNWRDWGKPQKASVKTVGSIPAKIQQDVVQTYQKHYHFSQLALYWCCCIPVCRYPFVLSNLNVGAGHRRTHNQALIIGFCILNCWVMHPVARVSTNTLIKPYATNVFCARFYCALLRHVSAPIGDHLQVKCTQKNIFKVTTVYVNGSVESAI